MKWFVALIITAGAAFVAEPTTRPVETPPASNRALRLIANIDVKDFGAETLRIGDLDDDGSPDLLLAQSVHATRQITCLTALTPTGRILWQVGKPNADNGRIYSDLPVQIYDWDADGHNEVLYVRQAKYITPAWDGKSPREQADKYEGLATMIVLDGATGREKQTFSLPAPADDSFLFANLTGGPRRQDLIVKDRYWHIWGVSHEGRELWHYNGSVGHYPAIADVDNDGRDEVFVGFALVDHDGKELFQHDAKGNHQDACWIVQMHDGTWRLLFGNGGIHCLKPDGTTLWEHALGEAQHVVAGRFRPGPGVQLAVVDRTPVPSRHEWAILYLYDVDGHELWHRKQEPGAWAIATVPINWDGPSEPESILVCGRGVGRPAVLYDGQGNITQEFPLPLDHTNGKHVRGKDFYALAANVWGDGRDEVIMFGGGILCIYANARLLEIPTLYNETLYPGM